MDDQPLHMLEEQALMHKGRALLSMIRELINECQAANVYFNAELSRVAEQKRLSALNLITTLVLRATDRRGLVSMMKDMCMELEGESAAMAKLLAAERVLMKICGETERASPPEHITHEAAQKLMFKNRELLYGPISTRYAAIMVTLDPATIDASTIKHLLESGMDCARINTAHDSKEHWARLVADLQRAEQKLNRVAKTPIHWDLAGPKLRTLPMVGAGYRVLRMRCPKDVLGRTTEPCRVRFVKGTVLTGGAIPLSADLFGVRVELADRISFVDCRGKPRSLYVVEVDGLESFTCEMLATTYFRTGIQVELYRRGLLQSSGVIGELPLIGAELALKVGSSLTLVPGDQPGSLADRCIPVDLAGAVVEVGQHVLLDDGQVVCVVTNVVDGNIVLRVEKAPQGFKLKPEKGVNLPESEFDTAVRAITEEDKDNLKFLAELMIADSRPFTVGVSFVRSTDDVLQLHDTLRALQIEKLCSTCLKIETARALGRLPSILLEALWPYPTCIMIARGDLAGEVGFENLASAQDDVTVMAASAHLPVIFATQVLESLNKNGIPSRAELSDLTQAIKTECVMLNKGPYLVEAVHFLSTVLCDYQRRQHKRRLQLRTVSSVDLGYYGERLQPKK